MKHLTELLFIFETSFRGYHGDRNPALTSLLPPPCLAAGPARGSWGSCGATGLIAEGIDVTGAQSL